MYIFVSSIGRSGTKFLSEVFKKVTDLPSFHGGELDIPDMRCCVGDALSKFNNNVEAEEIDRKIKQIQQSSVRGNYFESSQLFLSCFVEKAIDNFKPIYVIHLTRNPLETSKSYVNRNSIPGDAKSVWRPPINAKRNLLQLDEALLTPFQKNLWNWLENELRFHSYKHQFQKTFHFDFSDLNKIQAFERLFNHFGVSYSPKKLIEILENSIEKCNCFNANSQKTVVSVDDIEEATAFINLFKKHKIKLDIKNFNNDYYLKYEFIEKLITELSENNLVSQKKYIVFGDSHAKFFETKDQDEAIRVEVYPISVASIAGFGKRQSTLCTSNLIEQVVKETKNIDKLILKFGQVDVDLGYYYRLVINNKNIHFNELSKRLIDDYVYFIKKIPISIDKICVFGINLPSILDHKNAVDYTLRIVTENIENRLSIDQYKQILISKLPSIDIRTKLTLDFNEILKNCCLDNGIVYTDFIAETLDPETQLLKSCFHCDEDRDQHLKDCDLTRKLYLSKLKSLYKMDIVNENIERQTNRLLSGLDESSKNKLDQLKEIRKENVSELIEKFGEDSLRKIPNSIFRFTDYLVSVCSNNFKSSLLEDGLASIHLNNKRIFYGYLSEESHKKEFHYIKDLLPAIKSETYFLAKDIAVRYYYPCYKNELLHYWYPQDVLPPEGGVVVEVGAYTGIKTIRFVDECLGQSGRLLAIEMMPENFKILKKNVQVNKLDKNITLKKIGVWSSKGKVDAVGKGYQKNTLVNLQQLQGGYSKTVEVDTLDNILDEWLPETKNIDFLLITANGAETEILKGLNKWWPRITKICISALYTIDRVSGYDSCVKIVQERNSTILPCSNGKMLYIEVNSSDMPSENSIESETLKNSNRFKKLKVVNPEKYNFNNMLSNSIINTANQLKQEGKIAEALKLYDQITQNHPKFYWGYIKKGEALLANNKLNEAIDNFRQATEINTKSAIASYSLGLALVKQNSYDAAVSCFRQTIKKCKTNIPQKFYTSLWEVLAKQGKLKTTISSEQGNNQWRVGVAQVAITPKEPIWMAGYAGRNQPSQGVVHDLWAKAIIILPSDDLPRILVTLDICGLDRQVSNRISNALEKQYGLERDRIVLSFSHTHTGPVVGDCLGVMYNMNREQAQKVADYTEFLCRTIVYLVQQAFEQIKPASITWGIGRANFAVNRSENIEKQVAFNRDRLNLDGPVDHDVPILSVRDLQGELIAIVYGYACHCTVLNFYQLSGDYAGFANIAIEKQYPGAVAMFVAGCGADQNPIPRGDVALAQKYGEELGQAVISVIVGGGMEPLKPLLNSAYYEVDLAFSKLPNLEQIRKDTRSTNVYVARRAKRLLEQMKNQNLLAETYPYPIQLWKLGDKLNWIFMAGEAVVEYSLKLKLNLGSSNTWVASYCNDLCSYIPTQEVLRKHGYEGDRSMIYYGLPTTWDEKCLEEDIIGAVGELVRITNLSYAVH